MWLPSSSSESRAATERPRPPFGADHGGSSSFSVCSSPWISGRGTVPSSSSARGRPRSGTRRSSSSAPWRSGSSGSGWVGTSGRAAVLAMAGIALLTLTRGLGNDILAGLLFGLVTALTYSVPPRAQVPAGRRSTFHPFSSGRPSSRGAHPPAPGGLGEEQSPRRVSIRDRLARSPRLPFVGRRLVADRAGNGAPSRLDGLHPAVDAAGPDVR